MKSKSPGNRPGWKRCTEFMAGPPACTRRQMGVPIPKTFNRPGPCHRLMVVLMAGGMLISGQRMMSGTWTPLVNSAPNGIGTMLLLTDGTVLGQAGSATSWCRLTPDIHGSYVNGTWSILTPMNDSRLYCSSDVLRDGRGIHRRGGIWHRYELGGGLRSGEQCLDPGPVAARGPDMFL